MESSKVDRGAKGAPHDLGRSGPVSLVRKVPHGKPTACRATPLRLELGQVWRGTLQDPSGVSPTIAHSNGMFSSGSRREGSARAPSDHYDGHHSDIAGEASPAHSAPWLAGSPDAPPRGRLWGSVGSRNGTPTAPERRDAPICSGGSPPTRHTVCAATSGWHMLSRASLNDTRLRCLTDGTHWVAGEGTSAGTTMGNLQLLSACQTAVEPAGSVLHLQVTSGLLRLLRPYGTPRGSKHPQSLCATTPAGTQLRAPAVSRETYGDEPCHVGAASQRGHSHPARRVRASTSPPAHNGQ